MFNASRTAAFASNLPMACASRRSLRAFVLHARSAAATAATSPSKIVSMSSTACSRQQRSTSQLLYLQPRRSWSDSAAKPQPNSRVADNLNGAEASAEHQKSTVQATTEGKLEKLVAKLSSHSAVVENSGSTARDHLVSSFVSFCFVLFCFI